MYTDQLLREEGKAKSGLDWIGSSFLTGLSHVAWKAFQMINRRLPEGKLPHPKWAPGRILRSRERSAPPLGFPRETDSLCPRCVPEIRKDLTAGKAELSRILNQKPGEIKAQLVEEGDRILIKGPTTDFEQIVESMQIDRKAIARAEGGQSVGLKVSQPIKERDVVFKKL